MPPNVFEVGGIINNLPQQEMYQIMMASEDLPLVVILPTRQNNPHQTLYYNFNQSIKIPSILNTSVKSDCVFRENMID